MRHLTPLRTVALIAACVIAAGVSITLVSLRCDCIGSPTQEIHQSVNT